jgi:glutaredoxin
MDKVLILYTMKGCPYCTMIKEKLDEEKIDYIERNIDDHKDEYDLFVEVTENDFLPSFMIIESPMNNPKTKLFAPERDFNEIDEGVEIIREYFKR